MLEVLGSPKRLCNGTTRRDWLSVGGLGLLGLSSRATAQLVEAGASRQLSHPAFGKAKSCILIYLYGAPSQIETFDPKPAAPVAIRGELGTIASAIPGIRIGELLPKTAAILDRVSIVRSMSHPYPVHGVAFATTAVPAIDVAMELSPRDARHWPFIGSVVDYLDERNGRGGEIPRNLGLPWPFSSRRKGEVPRAGPYPGFLGQSYSPVWTQFSGEGTVPFTKSLLAERLELRDPYMGIRADGQFRLAASGTPNAVNAPDAVAVLDRLDQRRALLAQLEHACRGIERQASQAAYDRFQGLAFSLLSSTRLRAALDLRKEPAPIRESYGMTLIGQSALLARRLVETGGRFVTVFWDEYGLAGSGWDTHWNHFPRMRQELCPPFDAAFSGLIADLERRGLLNETLVAVLSEHGRTPQLSSGNGGGRDHWSRAYSILLAGAGIPKGRVYGRTDAVAGEVVDGLVSPKDILATILFLLGIDPDTPMRDRLGRPVPAAGDGRLRPELLA